MRARATHGRAPASSAVAPRRCECRHRRRVSVCRSASRPASPRGVCADFAASRYRGRFPKRAFVRPTRATTRLSRSPTTRQRSATSSCWITIWLNIDPFDDKGQFCDKGHSYLSAIFVANERERALAEQSRQKVVAQFPDQEVVTPILNASTFYPIKGDLPDQGRRDRAPGFLQEEPHSLPDLSLGVRPGSAPEGDLGRSGHALTGVCGHDDCLFARKALALHGKPSIQVFGSSESSRSLCCRFLIAAHGPLFQMIRSAGPKPLVRKNSPAGSSTRCGGASSSIPRRCQPAPLGSTSRLSNSVRGIRRDHISSPSSQHHAFSRQSSRKRCPQCRHVHSLW